MKTWYEAKMGNDHQGLVVEETTGVNIAVVYDRKHTALLAAAPDMLAALKQAAAVYGDLRPADGANIDSLSAYQNMLHAITKAEGRS